MKGVVNGSGDAWNVKCAELHISTSLMKIFIGFLYDCKVVEAFI